MTDSLPLAPSAITRLREVYDRYMGAPLGELNVTAEELKDCARGLGWPGGSSPLPWVRRMLDVAP